jgi:hypothetical protein
MIPLSVSGQKLSPCLQLPAVLLLLLLLLLLHLRPIGNKGVGADSPCLLLV